MSDTNTPKHLKVVQSGFENYNGPIGAYEFVDGISVDAIPRVDRDRLCAAFACVEFQENGKEVEAGVAARLVGDARNLRDVPFTPLERQTAAEKKAERLRDIKKFNEGKDRPIMTAVEIEALFQSTGISGLRELGGKWNVKNKSAVVLMQMILDAQKEYQAGAAGRLARQLAAIEAESEESAEPVTDAPDAPAKAKPKAKRKTKAKTKPVAKAVAPVEPIVPVVPELTDEEKVAAAAISGDLSSALNNEGE